MDTVDTEATESVATEAAPVETPVEPVEAPIEWDGDIRSLTDQPWLPASARNHIERHLEDFSTMQTRADFLTRMFDADDANAEVSKELESLRSALGDITRERDSLRGEADTYRQQVMEVEEDREYDRLKSAYPDIFDDCRVDEKNPSAFEGAWPMLLDLMVRGYDEATAARLARSMIPSTQVSIQTPAPVAEAASRRQVQIPASVAAASRGGNNPSSTINASEANENFEQRARRLMDEARARGE
jgi:chromosome segregation ATPase